MPLLRRGADVLWEALCPAFYSYPPSTIRVLQQLTKPLSRRRLCTTRRLNDSKIRFIRKNAPPGLHKPRKDFEKANGFFTSDDSTSIIKSGPVAYFPDPDGAKTNQSRSKEATWHSLWRKVSDKHIQRPRSLRQSTENSKIPELDERLTGPSPDYLGDRQIPKEIRKATDDVATIPYHSTSRTAGFKARRGQDSTELSDDQLYEELRRASSAGDYPRIHTVLEIMIKERGVKPDRRHYQALLLANTSAQHGSPVEVAGIVEEMEEEGIGLDSAAYHAIIKVLAVHPDYLLRRRILEEFRQRWFALSNDGWHDVIVGLLRDKQLDLAVETLQSVQQEGIRIQPWLYDMLIFGLCDVGEYDEALAILRFRVDNGEQLISGNVWHYLLDRASGAFHLAGTVFVWRKRVETSYLNPCSGICLNVLDTAARHEDLRLATDVIRVVGKRDQRLHLYHYEALIEAYVPAELDTAFGLLALMASYGTPPAASSTRPIFLYLCQSSHLPDQALSILLGVAKHMPSMPAEAVNVIIEGYIYHDRFDQALDTYKSLHTLCPSGPVTSTFNTLFRGCRGRKDSAMFLASEMVAMKIAPDALTYDRLVLVCLEGQCGNEDVGDAWRYFEEMRGAGWWPRRGTAMALARRCCVNGDERIWQLQGDEDGGKGLGRSVIQRMVDENWMKEVSGGGGRHAAEIVMEDEKAWR